MPKQIVCRWILFAALILYPLSVHAQEDVQIIEVIPIALVDSATGKMDTPEWMSKFSSYAEDYWDQATNRQHRILFRTGTVIPWRRCEDCRLSVFETQTLVPWLVQLSDRYKNLTRPADAYLLLIGQGGIDGAGFYMPEKVLAAQFGVAGFDMMAASGPQSALHEIGHFLGLPDRYDPHGTGSRALTLMGWIDDPVAPIDPVLRVELGWADVRDFSVGRDPDSKTLYPENVLRISTNEGAAWLGFQPILGLHGPTGWLFEIDWIGPDGQFERIEEHLLALDEAKLGDYELISSGGIFEIGWRFLPDTPRVSVTVRSSDIHTVERPPEQKGCGVYPDGSGQGFGILGTCFILFFVFRKMNET